MTTQSNNLRRRLLAAGYLFTLIFIGAAAVPTAGQAAVTEDNVKKSAGLFSRFFENNEWGSPESRSGPGSSMGQTAEVRRQLSRILRQYGIRTMVDAACGDFWWMKEVDLSQVAYTGIDVVPALIAQNEARYGRNNPPVHFQLGHISSTPLPAADLILARDVLIHQPFELVHATVRNVARSGAKWVLFTTYASADHNAEIEEGNWRPVNLQLPPFNLPAPTELTSERSADGTEGDGGKFMGLWRVEDLVAHGFAN